ncbi:acetylornithine transaminase [Williamsia phyllosphaerae]|uniref:Acetylornithine aminotransferase n=1 Tax=Williamsia phyllosphaerae TaxID=885042 RepID=A0ABQ1UYF9_9NOCA|nr:acetylornithine transaminase [Williamsia phyllosphaerae]GGF30466.1 acetylornithine aminotransferase [Williamsia phyllosphaerae]
MTAPMQDRWSSALMDNYGTPKIALRSGRGAVVTDENGVDYLDLLGGIAVNSLGHAHPAVIEAVTRQMQTLGHTSNLYINEPAVALAEGLLQRLGTPGRAFFCNSGAEANEAAFKIARRTGRPQIVAAENGFHGRTMGALAMTGQPGKRAPFEPMPAGVSFVPYGDIDALDAAITDQTAAVILEPIQGEGGVIVPPAGYLAAARRLTSERGALLILDEVQTGIGRTGTFYAHQAVGIVPDVMTLAKGLGGGLPIGACVATGPAADLLSPGQHGTTFGGNPICAAAALAVLAEIDSAGLLDHVASVGKSIATGVEALGHPLVSHVRGSGLLLGVVLSAPISAAVETAARSAGYLINAPAADVLRLAPPLVLTEDQANAFVADLPSILDTARDATKEAS